MIGSRLPHVKRVLDPPVHRALLFPHRPDRQARDHLAIATTMYREMEMTYWLEQAEAELREPA